MSRTEIRELMKQGLLDEALVLSQKQYDENPAAQWARLDLAWVYDAICKKMAAEGNLDGFKLSFLPLLTLNILQEDILLYDTACWRLRALIANGTTGMDDSSKSAFIQEIWEIICQMPAPHPSEAASVLCKVVYRNRCNWSSFVDFMDWWGWDTFRKEDYECEKMSNGKKMPVSLAEGCHIACAKIILQTEDKAKYNLYIGRLKALSDAHPEMLYPGFYTAKLLLATGGSKAEMLTAVLPFVRQKSNEFWAWQVLAEAEREDETLRLACLLRAANCKTKDEFLVRIHYQLAYELIARRDYVGAKLFLELYIKTKESTQSRLPTEVAHWTSSGWFLTTKIKRQDSPFLTMDYMGMTDRLLYADIEEKPMCISHFDSKTGRAFVVYGFQKRGVLKLPRSLRKIQYGTILMVRLDEARSHGDRLIAMTARVEVCGNVRQTSFLQCFEGKVTTNAKKTAFFVQHKSSFAFIPPECQKNGQVKEGDRVCVCAVLDYQKNKSCWAWRCISLSSI